MKTTDSSIPHNDSRLQAAWCLALPYAERVVVLGTQPPDGLLDWWRRAGTEVHVLDPQQLPTLAAPSKIDAFDLLLVWDVQPGVLTPHLRQFAPSATHEIAVWTARTGAFNALRWALADAGRRRQGWTRDARFYAWPEWQRPRQIIEHDKWTHTSLHVHRRSQSRWKTAVLQSSIGRLRAPASMSRWRRTDVEPKPSLLRRIVLQASDRLDSPLSIDDLRLSPNGVAIVRLLERDSRQPLGILKVPLTQSTIERVAINARALQWMQDQRGFLGDWSDAPPRLLAAEKTHGTAWTLEEHVLGSEAQTWEPGPARQATSHLAELLGHFQRAATARTDIATLQTRLQPQVDRLCARLDADLAQAVQEIWRNTVRNLEGVEIPIVPQHGDCKLENVLGDPERPMQLRLLDWELWRPDGLPLLDLLHLLLSRRRRQSGYSTGGSICRWLLSGDFAPWEQALIDGLAAGLDRQYVRAVPVLYWLERIAPIVQRAAWPHTGWAQANIEQVIERMKSRRAEVLA